MNLIEKLEKYGALPEDEYAELIESREIYSDEARNIAVKLRKKIYGNDVYIRGLIEVGNVCVNDCLYCGIRRSNEKCQRYVCSEDEIISCCKKGYALGFRTFVLQGGEGCFSADEISSAVKKIKNEFSDCAVTLSFGEFSFNEYNEMFKSGADRYLLRHETADRFHYDRLHNSEMSFDNRMRCLCDLKKIGFQTGCGFMVGSPFQTSATLAKDLKFIEEFKPEMCGIGPFVPANNTPFMNKPQGSAELTLFLLSVIRIISPNILLPSTTALGTVAENGRELGILHGANVVMPNLSPAEFRDKYSLYDNKAVCGGEAAEGLEILKNNMKKIGYEVTVSRGDIKKG